jgi:transcriptional regulator with XRE-family HTH domain
MTIHIGKIIKQKVEASGMNKSEFGRRINTSPQNVYGIFKRKSIDTDLLSKISDVLETDFFLYYSKSVNIVEENSEKYHKKDSEKDAGVPGDYKKLKEEYEQAKKEIAYLKRINELLEKQVAGKS